MLIKWLAALFQHGLVSVFALLVAIAAVWWVEPTTNGGIAFLLFIVFMLALAVLELGRKLVQRLRRQPAVTAATADPPSVDAPPAGPSTAAIEPVSAMAASPRPVIRSRRRPRARR